MIRHIVVARLKPRTIRAQIEEVVNELRALPARIEEIVSCEVGLDELHSERSYDFALVSTFAELEALNRYQVHPAHAAAAKRLRAACEHMVVVNYWFTAD